MNENGKMVNVKIVSYKTPLSKKHKDGGQKRLKKFLGKLEYITYDGMKYLLVMLRGNLTLVPPNTLLLFVGEKTLIEIMPYREASNNLFISKEQVLEIEAEAKKRGQTPIEYLDKLKNNRD